MHACMFLRTKTRESKERMEGRVCIRCAYNSARDAHRTPRQTQMEQVLEEEMSVIKNDYFIAEPYFIGWSLVASIANQK